MSFIDATQAEQKVLEVEETNKYMIDYQRRWFIENYTFTNGGDLLGTTTGFRDKSYDMMNLIWDWLLQCEWLIFKNYNKYY